jgi:hypothetical protein
MSMAHKKKGKKKQDFPKDLYVYICDGGPVSSETVEDAYNSTDRSELNSDGTLTLARYELRAVGKIQKHFRERW